MFKVLGMERVDLVFSGSQTLRERYYVPQKHRYSLLRSPHQEVASVLDLEMGDICKELRLAKQSECATLEVVVTGSLRTYFDMAYIISYQSRNVGIYLSVKTVQTSLRKSVGLKCLWEVTVGGAASRGNKFGRYWFRVQFGDGGALVESIDICSGKLTLWLATLFELD